MGKYTIIRYRVDKGNILRYIVDTTIHSERKRINTDFFVIAFFIQRMIVPMADSVPNIKNNGQKKVQLEAGMVGVVPHQIFHLLNKISEKAPHL